MEHRRRPNPFSTRPEGPRTAAERAVIRNFRDKENNPMPIDPAKKERESKEKPFEHIPDSVKLCSYLMKTKRAALCGSITKYDANKELNPQYPWAVERVLLEDLISELSKGAMADAERVNHLRSLIFAASWEATDAPDEEKLLAAVPSLLKAVPTLKEAFTETASSSHEDKRYEKIEEEDASERKKLESHIDLIAKAIMERPCGEDGEPAVRAIEAFTNQTAYEIMVLERQKSHDKKRGAVLRARLDRWRPIRNYLYYFRAYKRWCEISHGA